MFNSAVLKDNKELLEVISTESNSNSLKAISGSIKESFHALIDGTFGTLDKRLVHKRNVRAENLSAVIKFSAARGFTEKTIKSMNYVELRSNQIMVPTGFNANLNQYGKVLVEYLNKCSDLNDRVLKPLHSYVLHLLGNPEALSAVGPSNYADIDIRLDYIDEYKKIVNPMFDMKSGYQTRPYSTLVKNQNDAVDLVSTLNSVVAAFTTSNNKRDQINDTVRAISKTIDSLMLRIEQKPEEYKLNPLTTERLAKLINNAAVEVEFYAVLQVQTDLYIGSCVEVFDMLYENQ